MYKYKVPKKSNKNKKMATKRIASVPSGRKTFSPKAPSKTYLKASPKISPKISNKITPKTSVRKEQTNTRTLSVLS